MRWFSLLALLFLLGGPATAQDLPAEGATAKGALVIGRSTFALPPGEWKVVASGSGGNVTNLGTQGSTAAVHQVQLVQLDASRNFVASIFLRVPLSSSSVTRWNDSLCDRKDTLHRDAFSGRFDFPECLLVNHFVPFWANAPSNEFDRKTFDWSQKNAVNLPKTALAATYRKYAAGDFVIVSIAVNPEMFGQEPTVKTAWAESEWHPLILKNDPKRVSFVENFKKWSYVMADNASATLANRKPKLDSLPSLEELKVK
jgi:hypothetical protein